MYSIAYIKEKWAHAGFQKYLRNTGWMFLGQFSMIISLFINFWMARNLGPENFGIISYVFAFVGLFSFIANLGINDILIRELVNKPEERDKLLGTAAKILFIGGCLAFIISSSSAFIFETKPLIQLMIVLYSTIFLWSPVNVISAYFQSKVQAKKNAIAQIIQTTITSSLKIFLLTTNQGVIWLIFAFTLDYVIGSILYIWNYKKAKLNFDLWNYDKKIAYIFIHSSFYITLSSAAFYLLLKIDQIMIKAYLGEMSVGIYAAASKLSEIWYFIPGIICASIFPAIINSKKIDQNIYIKRLKKLLILLTISAIIIAIPISFGSHWIIYLLYGEKYLLSIPILQIYIWSGVGIFLMTGINRYFMVENYLKSILYYNLFAVILNVILNMFLITKIGLIGAAWATLISYLIIPIIIIIKQNIFKKHEK